MSHNTAFAHTKAPRWRTPSPMTASMIPPPIVSSVYHPLEAPAQATAEVYTSNELLLFTRKQRHLESELQLLLDAQAEGLLAGLDSDGQQDEIMSTGCSTPTARSMNTRSGNATPIRKSTKLSLRDARRGLLTTMRRLASLKLQESQYLEPDILQCSATVTTLVNWERKRERLQVKTREIDSGNEHQRAARLRQQAEGMQESIDELEAQLLHMKAEQRKLRREAQEVENTVQATSSSYTSSLGMLEHDIDQFLKRPPASIDTPLGGRALSDGATEKLWSLPREERTLEKARELFTHDQKVLHRRHQDIELEREALEEGAMVWKEVVKDVSAFERQLRESMSTMHNGHATDQQDEHGEDGGMQDLLAHLDHITASLESHYKHAESRNWKLLIAAIGAELEAFLKGKQILESALAAVQQHDEVPESAETEPLPSSSVVRYGTNVSRRSPEQDSRKSIADLDSAFGSTRKARAASDTDTEDDGPDPELLISHHDASFE